MSLENHIEDIRLGIKAGRFVNEAAVSQGIILRILQALSWPTFDVQTICPEYSLQGRRVDYALCHPPGKPIAFIEVKQIGQSEGAERQSFEYAFHVGVPLAILTDGREWNFFLPAEQGEYGERRVYKLDIVETDISESASRLTRYLHYDAIVSGAAIKAAREDYQNVSRDRQMKSTLPKAWTRLLEEENKEKPTAIGFMLDGPFFPARSARDVLKGFFGELAKRDPAIIERFVALPKHGRTRRYLSKKPEELFPDRPDLVKEYAVHLGSGWWLGTNFSRKSIEKIIEMACDVAYLKYGKDIQVNLGD